MKFNVFTNAESLITDNIGKLVVYPIGVLASGVAMVALPAMAAWVMYRSYLIMAGLSGDPLFQTIKDFLLKAVILIIAGSSPILINEFIVPLLDTQDALVTDFIGSGAKDESSIFTNIESNLAQVSALMETLATGEEPVDTLGALTASGEVLGFFDWAVVSIGDAYTNMDVSTTNLGGFFKLIMNLVSYGLVFIGLIVIGISAFLAVILNKIFFMLSIGFAPLFIMFLAFDATKGWFSSWLNATLGYCLSYPVIVLGVTILLDIYQTIWRQTTLTFLEAGICFISSVLFALLISRLGDIASSWFGAGNIADGTALAMTAVTKGMGSKVTNPVLGGAKASGKATAKGAYRLGRAANNARKKTKLKDDS